MKTSTIVGGAGVAYLLVGVWRYMVAKKDADALRARLAALPPSPPGLIPPPSPASVKDPSPVLVLLWPKQISGPFTG